MTRNWLILLTLTLFAGHAAASVITVPSAQAPTIQAGINIALNGDVICVSPGNYVENIDFLGKAIEVRSTGGANATFIFGTGAGVSVVVCRNGEDHDTVLDGFTITDGQGTDLGDGYRYGLGMLNLGASPIVRNCFFFANFIDDPTRGGGMANLADSRPVVLDCTFHENAATYGGGMYNFDSDPSLLGCRFEYNAVTSASGPHQGGAMCNLNGSHPEVVNCIFQSNFAEPSGQGGGVYGSSTDGLSNGLYFNCLFFGNTAAVGAGLMNNSGMVTVTNCTFTENTAPLGPAIFGNATTASNCIMWDHGGTPPVAGSVLVTYSDVQGGFPGVGNINQNPSFVNPGQWNFRVNLVSPVIDVGNSGADIDIAMPGVQNLLPMDLDGNARIMDVLVVPDGTSGVVDMGAYEYLGVLVAYSMVRGDPNQDLTLNIADAVLILSHLFDPSTEPLPCLAAADANSDETINIADSIYLLTYLFVDGSPPPPPFPDCGLVSDPVQALPCDQAACP